MGALLYIASHEASRNAVVKRLVAVLDARNAAAQMKAAEALAVLAARSDENRKAITAANAIEPLVKVTSTPPCISALAFEEARALLPDRDEHSDFAGMSRIFFNNAAKAVTVYAAARHLVIALLAAREQLHERGYGDLRHRLALFFGDRSS